jgi:hypothetical protein
LQSIIFIISRIDIFMCQIREIKLVIKCFYTQKSFIQVFLTKSC